MESESDDPWFIQWQQSLMFLAAGWPLPFVILWVIFVVVVTLPLIFVLSFAWIMWYEFPTMHPVIQLIMLFFILVY